jgi:hypothetical protein
LFEWQKQKGLNEPQGSFNDYVMEKLAHPRRNAIEDFQVLHLANRGYQSRNPAYHIGDEKLLENARLLLREAGCYGLVEKYKESLDKMKLKLVKSFPEIKIQEFHENRTQDKGRGLSGRVRDICQMLDEGARIDLILRNQLDIRLYEYALGGF